MESVLRKCPLYLRTSISHRSIILFNIFKITIDKFKKAMSYLSIFVSILASPWGVLQKSKFPNTQKLVYKLLIIVAYGLGFSAFAVGFVYDQSNMLPIYLIIVAFLLNLIAAMYLAFYYASGVSPK